MTNCDNVISMSIIGCYRIGRTTGHDLAALAEVGAQNESVGLARERLAEVGAALPSCRAVRKACVAAALYGATSAYLKDRRDMDMASPISYHALREIIDVYSRMKN